MWASIITIGELILRVIRFEKKKPFGWKLIYTDLPLA
jgi:hypothetical protein